MMLSSQISKSQPIVYQCLNNVLKGSSNAHSFLFRGERSKLIVDTANLFAASLICEAKSLEECDEVLYNRIAANKMPDFKYLDGVNKKIKREEFEELMASFSRSALESYGKKVVIIDGIENTVLRNLNSLLKFIEEPSDDVYIILISYKMDGILDTIVSRCLKLDFKKMASTEVELALVNEGINALDAHIACGIVNDYELALELLKKKNYEAYKEVAMSFMSNNSKKALFDLRNALLSYKDADKKDKVLLVLQILKVLLNDELYKENSSFSSQVLEKYLNALMWAIDNIGLNYNLALLIDHMLYMMSGKEMRT